MVTKPNTQCSKHKSNFVENLCSNFLPKTIFQKCNLQNTYFYVNNNMLRATQPTLLNKWIYIYIYIVFIVSSPMRSPLSASTSLKQSPETDPRRPRLVGMAPRYDCHDFCTRTGEAHACKNRGACDHKFVSIDRLIKPRVKMYKIYNMYNV